MLVSNKDLKVDNATASSRPHLHIDTLASVSKNVNQSLPEGLPDNCAVKLNYLHK